MWALVPAEKTSLMCDVCGLDVRVRVENRRHFSCLGRLSRKSARSTTYSVVNRADLAVTTGRIGGFGLRPRPTPDTTATVADVACSLLRPSVCRSSGIFHCGCCNITLRKSFISSTTISIS